MDMSHVHDELGAWLSSLPFNVFGVVTFRHPTAPHLAKLKFKGYMASINKAVLGPDWRNRGKGLPYVVSGERTANDVYHLHVLVYIPDIQEHFATYHELDLLWQHSKHASFEPIRMRAGVFYQTKSILWNTDNIDYEGDWSLMESPALQKA